MECHEHHDLIISAIPDNKNGMRLGFKIPKILGDGIEEKKRAGRNIRMFMLIMNVIIKDHNCVSTLSPRESPRIQKVDIHMGSKKILIDAGGLHTI